MDFALVFFNIFLVLFLVFLNALFVAAEFAMVKVRSTRLDTLIHEGNTRAKFAKQMVDHLDAYLSACQLGITLASLGLGWIGEPAVAKMIEPFLLKLNFSPEIIHTISFAIGFSLITALHIVLGELAPKSVAIQKADLVTLWTSVPMVLFYKTMYPFIWLLNGVANLFIHLIGIPSATEHEAAHTEEEIRILMEESHKQGYINKTELTLVDNVFDFTGRHAKDVMIPRTDMICLYVDAPFQKNIDTALSEQFTRYPVCDPDKDNIIGFVHIKDLLSFLSEGKSPSLKDIKRDLMVVPESIPISDLLKLLQKKKEQIALVIDEYGGTAGLVTAEDILEEIVGEIQDEFDEERPAVEKLDNNSYSIDGRMLLEDVNEQFGLSLYDEDIDTIGGWLSAHVEMPPQQGQKAEGDGYELSVEKTDNMRITRVSLKLYDKKEEEASSETN